MSGVNVLEHVYGQKVDTSIDYGVSFLSRVSTLTRDIDIAILSVCPSVTFRYQMKTA